MAKIVVDLGSLPGSYHTRTVINVGMIAFSIMIRCVIYSKVR